MTQWKELWLGRERYYLVAKDEQQPRFEKLVGKSALFVVARERRQDAAHQSAAVKDKGDRPGGLSYSGRTAGRQDEQA